MGAMVTYGSYLSRSSNLRVSGGCVAAFDTGIALLAGFMIFPALFALGRTDPAAGPTLIFEVLPAVFAEMPLGGLVGVSFFVLLSIAALTSTVSLLEVPVAYFIDEKGWSRTKAGWVVGGIALAIGIPSVLSQGAVPALGEMTFLGVTSFMYIMDHIFGNISLAVGALLLSIFVGWVWGMTPAGKEMSEGSGMTDRAIRIWGFFLRFVCPVVIFVVLLNVFGIV